MFPNPQDALPLPRHPSVDGYEKLARELVDACRSGDIRAWVERWLRSLRDTRRRTIDDMEAFAREKLAGERKCVLADAQFVIARSHGFPSWPAFAKHIDALASPASSDSRFERAADAIVAGDIETVEQLLAEERQLIHARSAREHRATLLHYVAANGVENYRQKTPKNIVAVTGILLRAGADIDATADVYGGGATTLGLAATSVHPETAGVQEALLETLLDHGARMQERLIVACLANGRARAAEFLASRGAAIDFVSAAALGRCDFVERSFDDATEEQRKSAFLYACEYGQIPIVEFFLGRGADVAAHRGDGQTALHRAVIGARPDVVKLLLRCHPPLDAKNVYGGTPFGQALWSAAHSRDSEPFVPILETLIAAGARVPPRHVPVNPRIDDLLRKFGSEPEPAWSWD